jgi:uncharacterized membrane protein YoaK (UPF0700 family)
MAVKPPSPRTHLRPALFGFVGGFVDVCAFVALGGLFTAHITGNMAVLGAAMAQRPHAFVARLLAVPFFMLAVAGGRLLNNRMERRGNDSLRLILLIEILLLTGFLAGSVAVQPWRHPDAPLPILAAAAAVGAMGLQNVLVRMAGHGNTPTTAMTGNLTQFVLDLLDLFSPPPGRPSGETAAGVLRSGVVLGSFMMGVVVGGLGMMTVGVAAVGVPIVVLILLLPARKPRLQRRR